MKTYLKKFFFLTCLILMQNSSFACGSSCNDFKNEIKSKSQCCSKIKENKLSKENCCNSVEKKKQKRNCGGKCKRNSCNCVKTFSNFLFSSNINFYYKQQVNFFEKEGLYCCFNLNTSSGFYLIWTPPNI